MEKYSPARQTTDGFIIILTVEPLKLTKLKLILHFGISAWGIPLMCILLLIFVT